MVDLFENLGNCLAHLVICCVPDNVPCKILVGWPTYTIPIHAQ